MERMEDVEGEGERVEGELLVRLDGELVGEGEREMGEGERG